MGGPIGNTNWGLSMAIDQARVHRHRSPSLDVEQGGNGANNRPLSPIEIFMLLGAYSPLSHISETFHMSLQIYLPLYI